MGLFSILFDVCTWLYPAVPGSSMVWFGLPWSDSDHHRVVLSARFYTDLKIGEALNALLSFRSLLALSLAWSYRYGGEIKNALQWVWKCQKTLIFFSRSLANTWDKSMVGYLEPKVHGSKGTIFFAGWVYGTRSGSDGYPLPYPTQILFLLPIPYPEFFSSKFQVSG